jgi:hypothetical protein
MISNSFLVFPFLLLLFTSCNDIDFNSKKWKNWEEIELTMNIRWYMVDDLINNYGLKEKTKNKIIELLGESSNVVFSSPEQLYYHLGPCRSGIDYGSLNITFNNGRVSNI